MVYYRGSRLLTLPLHNSPSPFPVPPWRRAWGASQELLRALSIPWVPRTPSAVDNTSVPMCVCPQGWRGWQRVSSCAPNPSCRHIIYLLIYLLGGNYCWHKHELGPPAQVVALGHSGNAPELKCNFVGFTRRQGDKMGCARRDAHFPVTPNWELWSESPTQVI